MLALWICVHEDNTSCPNILKEKQKDLGKSSKKHLRGAAAAELLRTLWDLDFSELKSLLLSSLGATYALPNAENFSQFTFAAAPTVSADLQIIGSPVVSKSQKAVISQKPAKVEKNKHQHQHQHQQMPALSKLIAWKLLLVNWSNNKL